MFIGSVISTESILTSRTVFSFFPSIVLLVFQGLGSGSFHLQQEKLPRYLAQHHRHSMILIKSVMGYIYLSRRNQSFQVYRQLVLSLG